MDFYELLTTIFSSCSEDTQKKGVDSSTVIWIMEQLPW